MVFTCPMLKPEPIGKRASDWGEGPFWHEGILYYVDIRGEAVIAFDPGSEEEKIWEVGQQVGFVVTCVSGRLLYGGENGLYFLNRENGTSQPITDPEPDQKGNRFNDGKTSPDGRLFAGTISGQRLPEAALYRPRSGFILSPGSFPGHQFKWNRVVPGRHDLLLHRHPEQGN
jgi:sugar lactone lactonase YvrE